MMTRYLRLCAWVFSALVGIPFVFGVFGSWSSYEILVVMILVMAWPVAAFVLVVGFGALLALGIKAARRAGSFTRGAVIVLATPAVAAAAVMLAGPAESAGGKVGDVTYLMANRARFEAIIARARAGTATEEDSRRYTVDQGPPVRVAFDPDGIIDNWSGVIYDPTGVVMQAKGFDAAGRLIGPETVIALFGGDLVGCRPIWRPYYRCSFT